MTQNREEVRRVVMMIVLCYRYRSLDARNAVVMDVVWETLPAHAEEVVSRRDWKRLNNVGRDIH